MRFLHLILVAACVLTTARCVTSSSSSSSSTWHCNFTKITPVPTSSSPVIYKRGVCTGEVPSLWPFSRVGPITVDIIEADTRHPRVFVTPIAANSSSKIAPLSAMFQYDRQGPLGTKELVGAVNMGYFFEVNKKNRFFDDVCFGKTYADALSPVDKQAGVGITGVGDCLSIRDGEITSTNCGAESWYGYNRPSVLVIENGNGTEMIDIVVQEKNDPPRPEWRRPTTSVAAAGPNMVSTHKNGTAYVDIPKDDENLNRLEKSANTASDFRRSDKKFFLVAFDGHDGCKLEDPTCGIYVSQFSYFMKDFLNVVAGDEPRPGRQHDHVRTGRGRRFARPRGAWRAGHLQRPRCWFEEVKRRTVQQMKF